jgi:uncharacterized protein (DUF1697 family)
MALQIALLRAVNVGGRSLAMSELAALFGAIGFAPVRTILQSGNVVFDGGGRRGAALESLLEAETEKHFALKTDVLVRSAAAWRAIVAANPFPAEAKADPSHLLVMPLKNAPGAAQFAALAAAIVGRERAASAADGAALYAVYPDGIGRSKLTTALIEKKLATRGTARNWNTALKLLAAVEADRA